MSPRSRGIAAEVVRCTRNQSSAELPAASAVVGIPAGCIERIELHSLGGHATACSGKAIAIGIEGGDVGLKGHLIVIPQISVRTQEERAGETNGLGMQPPVFANVVKRPRPVQPVRLAVKVQIVLEGASNLHEWGSRKIG